MIEHICIKPNCGNKYKDKDPDPYYCPSCVEQKKVIAKKIDSKLSTVSKKKVMTDLEAYDQAPKVHGFLRVRL